MFTMPTGGTPEATTEKQTVRSTDRERDDFAEELRRAQSADEKAKASGRPDADASILALLGMRTTQKMTTEHGIPTSDRWAGNGNTESVMRQPRWSAEQEAALKMQAEAVANGQPVPEEAARILLAGSKGVTAFQTNTAPAGQAEPAQTASQAASSVSAATAGTTSATTSAEASPPKAPAPSSGQSPSAMNGMQNADADGAVTEDTNIAGTKQAAQGATSEKSAAAQTAQNAQTSMARQADPLKTEVASLKASAGADPARISAVKPNGTPGTSTVKPQNSSSTSSTSTSAVSPESPAQSARAMMQPAAQQAPAATQPELSLVGSDVSPDLADGTVDGESSADPALIETSSSSKSSAPAAAAQARSLPNGAAAALGNQVAFKLLERFDGKTSKFEIRLDPAELGKVNVKIEVDGDGRIQAVLAAQDSSAADALNRNLRQLENALTQAGLSLDENGLRVEIDARSQSDTSSAQKDGTSNGSGQADVSADAETAQAEANASITPDIQFWSRSRLDVRV